MGYTGNKPTNVPIDGEDFRKNSVGKDQIAFNAADLDAPSSDNNFTNMPQVGGSPIVESGSNSDGEWVRYADRTQICYTVVNTD
uniref:hypothetical protein n=1 Tax=Methanohalobium sp. TaxID=2837493 RepID=UPI0025FA2DB5